ncbi:calpain-2 catalytic subunit isoform X2 [Anabrus simplex]
MGNKINPRPPPSEQPDISSVNGSGLFCDPEFPATDESLFQDPDEKVSRSITWKRPHEIVSRPEIFVDGANRTDVRQGNLGDCWFLSAAAAIASRPDLIKQVIPEGQVLYGQGYRGLVTFRFWRMGTWVTVDIDDRLPVDENGDLYYATCRDPNEFWLPLLEKAFAKFHGNYNNIDGGQLSESFISMTGYISETIETDELPMNDLFNLIRLEFRNGSLISCSTGTLKTRGLLTLHAYTVTGAWRIEMPHEGVVKLVRVCNPWGKIEWCGDWCENDPRWEMVPGNVKKEMEYRLEDDGEFWITMSDFLKKFEVITIATKVPRLDITHPVLLNNLFAMQNSWLEGKTAGGSRKKDIRRYSSNPQYLLTVKEPDDDDICQPGEAPDELICRAITTCNVIVELVQEHNRKKFQDFYKIGFSVYPYEKSMPRKRLTAGDLNEVEPLEGSVRHLRTSSVVGRLNLKPGSYVIIPCTKEPDLSRDFLLRVYCRKLITLIELC